MIDLCFCRRAYDMEKATEITVVYGDVNVFRRGAAYFGALTYKTPAIFCGGDDSLMRLLKTEYPDANPENRIQGQ